VGRDNFEAVEHGGDLLAAKARFPEAPEPWIDLSTGINPTPYPFNLPPPAAYARLPAPGEIRALEAIAARAYGVRDPACVAAASGSQTLIQLLPLLRGRGRVAVLGPTYREHERCWVRAGFDLRRVGDLEAALDEEPDVIVAVNPNNPDGRLLPRADLLHAANRLAERGGWFVIDEAFADCEPDASLASAHADGVIVLRSLGKAYGLAGLRLGFSVANPALSARIRQYLGPWPVSGPAIAIGGQALANPAWLSSQSGLLAASAAKLDGFLVNAGFTIVGGTRLFRLVRHPEAPARFEQLAKEGIWSRQFSGNPDHLRFGNPPASAWKRLRTALRTG
jgi:cobalamin biosynthesis protein CobC